MPAGKVEIVHHLADRFGYCRYLEIATPVTGHQYALIDRDRFDDCCRLMYLAPPDFSDGLNVDYRCPDIDIASALSEISSTDRRFDIILVDPFHTYEASIRDLNAAFSLLKDGGTMVVHDCLPPNQRAATPTFILGEWCGVTYRAFLDFVLDRRDLQYFTVDTDYGCGVVRKTPRRTAKWHGALAQLRRRRLVVKWKRLSDDNQHTWRFFWSNKKRLLQLVDYDVFIDGIE